MRDPVEHTLVPCKRGYLAFGRCSVSIFPCWLGYCFPIRISHLLFYYLKSVIMYVIRPLWKSGKEQVCVPSLVCLCLDEERGQQLGGRGSFRLWDTGSWAWKPGVSGGCHEISSDAKENITVCLTKHMGSLVLILQNRPWGQWAHSLSSLARSSLIGKKERKKRKEGGKEGRREGDVGNGGLAWTTTGMS